MKTKGLGGGGGGEDWPGSSRSRSKNLRRAHIFLVYFFLFWLRNGKLEVRRKERSVWCWNDKERNELVNEKEQDRRGLVWFPFYLGCFQVKPYPKLRPRKVLTTRLEFCTFRLLGLDLCAVWWLRCCINK